MLRASSHLPSISAPALTLTAFTISSIPTLNFSSSPLFSRNLSNFSILYHTFLPTSRTSNHFAFLSSRKLPSMAGLPCPRASASFSTESSSGEGREILIQHLLLKEDDLKLLVELQHRSIQGEDLSDLALEYSICPSKEEGGMLGWVRKGQMVPEFEEAAFKAPLNKILRCKTKFGWHLFQVLSERKAALLEDIQPDELYAKMQDPSFFEEAQLIDVREPDEVAQASLPGFKVLSLRQFGSWGPEITTNFDPHKDTYVMCHHGMRSLQVAKWLQTQGFTKIYNLSGGIHAYAVKVDSSIPTY